MASGKQYGLIRREPKKEIVQSRLSVFDDDSDEDGKVAVGKSLQREAARIQAKKQTKLNIDAALAEDPNVFEYDEVYDSMVEKKAQETFTKKATDTRKSKYIDALLKTAEHRKLELERVIERKVQKERIAEGEKYADKESFVTSAYKKKMQEMQEQEEKDKQEARLEALTDVTKQKDLSGFYRQLYRQTLGTEATLADKSQEEESAVKSSNADRTVHLDSETHAEITFADAKRGKDSRQFRKRRNDSNTSEDNDYHHRKLKDKSERKTHECDEDSGDSETEVKKPMSKDRVSRSQSSSQNEKPERQDHRRERGDYSTKRAVSSRSSSASSSDEEANLNPRKRSNYDRTHKDAERDIRKSHRDTGSNRRDKNAKRSEEPLAENIKESKQSIRERLMEIFKKRNVGEAFEQARERYLARKEARMVFAV